MCQMREIYSFERDVCAETGPAGLCLKARHLGLRDVQHFSALYFPNLSESG
jgi:hypothetical protein